MDYKFRKINVIYDIKPVKDSGSIDVEKISEVSPTVDLKRIPKDITQDAPVVDGFEGTGDDIVDFHDFLRKDSDPKIELAKFGIEVNSPSSNTKPRYRRTVAKQNEDERFDELVSKIREPMPREENYEEGHRNYDVKGDISQEDIYRQGIQSSSEIDNWVKNLKEKIPDTKESTVSKKKRKKFLGLISIAVIVFVAMSFFSHYGLSIKNEVTKEGEAAVSHLLDAGDSLKGFDFEGASGGFSKAYEEFTKAGDSLNFLGGNISSIISFLPGGGKLKSAQNLIEVGKLISEAGKHMADAVVAISRTKLILGSDQGGASAVLYSLQDALSLSRKNIQKTKALLADIDEEILPEDNREALLDLKAQIPLFEIIIDDAISYSRFFESFVALDKSKRYLFLFQNNSELRPTGGFPGTYGVVSFTDGLLSDFFVDDVYNLDGQLSDNIIPPKQMQHITPNWGMRDANWFIDFPTSAKKSLYFFEKVRGFEPDGVVTLTPDILLGILDVIGSIDMPEYNVTLNSSNFLAVIQEEVEYGNNRSQPKSIIKEFVPKLIERLNTATTDQWLEIFNIAINGLEQKDILMYFNDLDARNFALENGFAGEVKDTDSDYLMVTFSNIKGSKTDAVTDTKLELQTSLTDNQARHKLIITRTHNGDKSDLGFYKKQNVAYVRILVPKGAKLIDVKRNDIPGFKPLISYSGTDFKTDQDLFKLESTFDFDTISKVSTYEESGKTGFGFWMIVDPGRTRTIEVNYTVSTDLDDGSYELYIQKQPGLRLNNFEYIVIGPSNLKLTHSAPELDNIGNIYILNDNLEKDLPVTLLFEQRNGF